MHSDIAEAVVEGSMTGLIMFDLSTAFDVIDHTILLKRLEFSFKTKKTHIKLVAKKDIFCEVLKTYVFKLAYV